MGRKFKEEFDLVVNKLIRFSFSIYTLRNFVKDNIKELSSKQY